MLLLLGLAFRAAAQEPTGHELGVQGLATIADPSFAGAGVSWALRPGGRTRLAVVAAPGTRDGAFAMRGELDLHFLLAPSLRSGAGVYGIAGIAGLVGRRDAGYLVLGSGWRLGRAGVRDGCWRRALGADFDLPSGWRRRWLHWPGRPP